MLKTEQADQSAEPRSTTATADQQRSVRPVIEHALTDYGYSPDTVRTLIDRLIQENGEQ